MRQSTGAKKEHIHEITTEGRVSDKDGLCRDRRCFVVAMSTGFDADKTSSSTLREQLEHAR